MPTLRSTVEVTGQDYRRNRAAQLATLTGLDEQCAMGRGRAAADSAQGPLQILLTGDPIDATRAREIGLASDIVAATDLTFETNGHLGGRE
ncbi:MAG: hypothetical protein JWN03_9086 [Nocardia sp.]|nr:hypothetical protein [Nocardia sp.]